MVTLFLAILSVDAEGFTTIFLDKDKQATGVALIRLKSPVGTASVRVAVCMQVQLQYMQYSLVCHALCHQILA